MKKTNAITEGALFSGIFLVLLLVTMYMPFIGTFTMLLLPIPIMIYTYKHPIQYAIAMFVVISLLTIIVATILALPITIVSGVGGIAIGLCLYYKRTVYETWAIGSVSFALGFVLVFLISEWLFKINFISEINSLIDDSIEYAKQILEQIGNVPADTLQLLEQQMQQVIYLIPAIIGIVGIIFSFITLWFGFKFMNRLYKENFAFPAFRNFRLPSSLIWYYLASIVLMWIEPEQGNVLNQIAVNLSMLTGLLIVLQGLSFIAFYCHLKNKSNTLLVLAIVLLIFLPVFFIFPLRILGIIDLGFNLRDQMTKSKK
jgi:uncharacterized protein YybS (DUF2232 family)